MPNPTSTNRGYFRFKTGEFPREDDLNAGLVEKVDQDVADANTAIAANATAIGQLEVREDKHTDSAGNLTQAPPEFSATPFTPVYVSPTQFYVIGNQTATFTVARALRANLSATSPVSHISVSTFDFPNNRTVVTLADPILNGTLSSVDVGFIQLSQPKITVADLTFDPATQAELDAHKTSGDHDSRYPPSVPSGARMFFDNDTAPTGWSRDTNPYLNDRMIRIVGSGARADGGSWVVTGLTANSHAHALGNHLHYVNHQHDIQNHVHGQSNHVHPHAHNHNMGGHVHGMNGHTHIVSGTGFAQTGPVSGFALGATSSEGPSTPNTEGPGPNLTDPENQPFTGGPTYGFTEGPNVNATGLAADYSSGPTTNSDPSGALGVVSTGTWRPLHRDTILCQKV